MTAVAILTRDRSRALGRSPADGHTEESRWRAQVDVLQIWISLLLSKNGLLSAPVQASIKNSFWLKCCAKFHQRVFEIHI